MQGKHENPIKNLARGRQSMYVKKREKQVSLYENPIYILLLEGYWIRRTDGSSCRE